MLEMPEQLLWCGAQPGPEGVQRLLRGAHGTTWEQGLWQAQLPCTVHDVLPVCPRAFSSSGAALAPSGFLAHLLKCSRIGSQRVGHVLQDRLRPAAVDLPRLCVEQLGFIRQSHHLSKGEFAS